MKRRTLFKNLLGAAFIPFLPKEAESTSVGKKIPSLPSPAIHDIWLINDIEYYILHINENAIHMCTMGGKPDISIITKVVTPVLFWSWVVEGKARKLSLAIGEYDQRL